MQYIVKQHHLTAATVVHTPPRSQSGFSSILITTSSDNFLRPVPLRKAPAAKWMLSRGKGLAWISAPLVLQQEAQNSESWASYRGRESCLGVGYSANSFNTDNGRLDRNSFSARMTLEVPRGMPTKVYVCILATSEVEEKCLSCTFTNALIRTANNHAGEFPHML